MSFKICLVGCGTMANRHHGPSYRKYAATSLDTDLCACCDIDEEKAVRFRERFEFARHYTDIEDMLDEERPDAVCMVVPEILTCELACRVLEKGYPLLMEKPPGMTTEEIDRIIAAADASGAPSQVAFNRRYSPLMRELVRRLRERFSPERIQHVCYDITRVERADHDFSLTAIHGIDAVRFIAGSDYANIRFHYQELPDYGPTVANIFMDCTLVSGATAHLSFCPVAGAAVERAIVHCGAHTFYLNLPHNNGLDARGRLQCLRNGDLEKDLTGIDVGCGHETFELMGFYDENASFFDDVRSGRRPAGDLRKARQSVEVAQYMRQREAEYCYKPEA